MLLRDASAVKTRLTHTLFTLRFSESCGISDYDQEPIVLLIAKRCLASIIAPCRDLGKQFGSRRKMTLESSSRSGDLIGCEL